MKNSTILWMSLVDGPSGLHLEFNWTKEQKCDGADFFLRVLRDSRKSHEAMIGKEQSVISGAGRARAVWGSVPALFALNWRRLCRGKF